MQANGGKKLSPNMPDAGEKGNSGAVTKLEGADGIKSCLLTPGHTVANVTALNPPYPEFRGLPNLIKSAGFRALLGVVRSETEGVYQAKVLAWSDPSEPELIQQFDTVMPAMRSLYGYSKVQTEKRGALIYKQGLRTGKRTHNVKEWLMSRLRKKTPEELQTLLAEARATAEEVGRSTEGRARVAIPNGNIVSFDIDPRLSSDAFENILAVGWYAKSMVCFPLQDESQEMEVASEQAVKALFEVWCTSSSRITSEYLINAYDGTIRQMCTAEVIEKIQAWKRGWSCQLTVDFFPWHCFEGFITFGLLQITSNVCYFLLKCFLQDN